MYVSFPSDVIRCPFRNNEGVADKQSARNELYYGQLDKLNLPSSPGPVDPHLSPTLHYICLDIRLKPVNEFLEHEIWIILHFIWIFVLPELFRECRPRLLML